MKHWFTLLTAIFFFTTYQPLAGQQPGHYSLYFMNKMHWNPAYAGLDHSLSITGAFRKQWVGLEGSPSSQNVNAHMPLYIASGGIGINIENDMLGAERSSSALMAYNYQMPLGSGILSVGLAGGIIQRALDGRKLRTPEGDYTEPGVIQHNDDLLPLVEETATLPTFDAGLFYQSEWLDIGISAKNLVESTADFSTVSLQLKRNYFAIMDVHLEVNGSFTLHPSVFVRSDFIQTQTDLGIRVQYNDNIFGGASLRGYNSNSIDAVSIIAGFNLSENLKLAYAYDLTMSDLNVVSNGSHEIMLNFNLNKRIGEGKPPNIIYNPRSL
jgi:type IX secretion system PorP/SprF family membrane protein